MKPRLGRVVWLTSVWIALWGELSIGNAIAGLVAATVVTVLLPIRPDATGVTRVRPLWLLRFIGRFAVDLVKANAVVAWEVITPRNRINEGIVAVRLEESRGVVVTLLANAITLTPGTLVVDVKAEPTVLYVHVLHLRSIEDARAYVHHLERLLVRALPRDRFEASR